MLVDGSLEEIEWNRPQPNHNYQNKANLVHISWDVFFPDLYVETFTKIALCSNKKLNNSKRDAHSTNACEESFLEQLGHQCDHGCYGAVEKDLI